MEMNDLISRQEVKEILRTEWVKLFPIELDPYLSLAMEKIENIPSAEPKKGQWIAYKGVQIPERHGLHYCSNCCHSLHLASNGRVYNYCPRCGAKMEVEK